MSGTNTIEMVHLEISKVTPSKTNPRKNFDAAALQELSISVKKHGILQPILVRPLNGSGTFEIVAGERRFRAAKAAELKEIPATVRELSDQAVLEIQVIENLQREDLHPMEEAEGYRQLIAIRPKGEAPYDAARIAERIGRSVKYVYDRIKLLNLIEPLRKEFSEDKITAGHAILLARLSAKDQKLVHDRGLYQHEHAHFKEIVADSDGKKAVSVRELQQFIDEHCRFVPERDVDPMLFPETTALLKSADPKKKSDKIVAISLGYVQDTARTGGEKHVSPLSWKRADGKQGSKPCDFSVIGVVVAGENRAKAFRVCLQKEKCKTHWAEWQRARAKNRGQTGPLPAGVSVSENARKEKERIEEERRKEQLEQERFNRALPEILKALAEAVKKAPIPQVGKKIVEAISRFYLSGDLKAAMKFYVPGKSAEEMLRHAMYVSLLYSFDDEGETEIETQCKAFGVDMKAVIDRVTPVQTSAPKAGKKT
ncbi:MAG: ParB/RepB/Spo0J family partition protein [Candidatus Peribacteraceae bacterium]|nr:ParB/RepB/Spo0J family partition protein [Candidatus Peribacteraceae bacterium]